MTWRAFSYTLMVLLAVVAIATTASSGVSSADNESSRADKTLAVQSSVTVTDPGTRLVVLIVGLAAVMVTYRRALLNLRRRS